MLYLDSSALVKRYVAEPGSSAVQSAIVADPDVTTCLLSRVEVPAALAAAARAGRIPNLGRLLMAFRVHWSQLIVIGIDPLLADTAAALAERHALRGYDAVQLAAALVAAQAAASVGSDLTFAVFDSALRRAAVAEGLTLLT